MSATILFRAAEVIGASLGKVVTKVSQVLCVHNDLLEYGERVVRLKCVKCGRRTHGWKV